MKIPRVLLLLLLFLAQPALALPTGDWRADFYGAIGSISVAPERFEFVLDEDGTTSGFAGPLARISEPVGSGPGKLIVGPIKDGEYDYEVVWYYPTDGPRARFFCDPEGYDSLAEAEASKPEFQQGEAALFLTEEFFAQCWALPILPEPSKEELVALLQEALRRHKAEPNMSANDLMETLMIDKGFHPNKSREPFELAVQKYAGEPDVGALLGELEN